MNRTWTALAVVAAALIVGGATCTGGGTVTTQPPTTTTTVPPLQPTNCMQFSALKNTFHLNNVLGSDPNAINSTAPLISLNTDGGLASYNLTLDAKSIGSFKNITSGSTICINPSGLSNGSHTIGGSEVSPHAGALTGYTFKVDTIPPASPSTPVYGGHSGGSVYVSGTAMYPDAHSVSVFDGTALAGGAMVASNGTWSVATSPLSAGTHRLTAVAFDTAGNRSASSSALTVTI